MVSGAIMHWFESSMPSFTDAGSVSHMTSAFCFGKIHKIKIFFCKRYKGFQLTFLRKSKLEDFVNR